MNKKVILCLFGVINRSIKYTSEILYARIIKHLKKNQFLVDVFVFNLISDNCIVDGTNVNNNDYKMIEAKYYESKLQSELDNEIETYVSSKSYKITYVSWYTDNQIHNTMRQMYSEWRVGKFLEQKQNEYDYAIVCGPDYYLTQNVNINDLSNSKFDESIYISEVNPGMDGYTNGYYMSHNLTNLIILLCRYENILPYLNGFKGDYEQLLKKYCDSKEIKISITDQVFFKIRANKTIFWQGFNTKHKSDPHNVNEYNTVMKRYNLKPQTVFERR